MEKSKTLGLWPGLSDTWIIEFESTEDRVRLGWKCGLRNNLIVDGNWSSKSTWNSIGEVSYELRELQEPFWYLGITYPKNSLPLWTMLLWSHEPLRSTTSPFLSSLLHCPASLSTIFFSLSFNRLSLCSVQFSRSVMSDSLRPHGLQHARLACPSPTPGAYSNACPLSQWCHPTISLCLIFIPSTGYFLYVSHSIWFSMLLSLELVLLLKWSPLIWHIPF